MSPNSNLAVIRTQLPYLDRRALSEAWFSALHLASDGPQPPAARERRLAASLPAGPESARNARALRLSPERPPASRPQERRLPSAIESVAPLSTTVQPARTAGKQVVSEVARSYPPFRTSLTVGVEKHRVQLLLRRDGATLHVIALCKPQIADVVRQALSCADAHLRLRGERVRSSVQTYTSKLPRG